jgi:hypothetical protein
VASEAATTGRDFFVVCLCLFTPASVAGSNILIAALRGELACAAGRTSPPCGAPLPLAPRASWLLSARAAEPLNDLGAEG